MTEQEAAAIVAEAVQDRVPKITDGQRSDWISVLMRTDVATARQIIREMATDPDEGYLAAKGFAKRLRDSRKQAAGGSATGKCRMGHGHDGEYTVYVASEADPNIRKELAYPTVRVWEGGAVTPVPWTPETLIDALQPTLRHWRNTYVGKWFLDIRTAEHDSYCEDREPEARRQAEELILASPDTPGRRFLLSRQATLLPAMKVVPSIPQPVTTASREMLDNAFPERQVPAIFTKPLLATGKGGPHRWDEIAPDMVDDDHVPDATKMVSAGREAGEGE